MHEVGAGLLIATLKSSPAVVTLVQAAAPLRAYLFDLFAVALANRPDKRRMLIPLSVVLTVVVALLAVLVWRDLMTPARLIALALAIGTGEAFMAPTRQAVVPQLAPRPRLRPAIAVYSMGINRGRAIRPALARLLIAVLIAFDMSSQTALPDWGRARSGRLPDGVLWLASPGFADLGAGCAGPACGARAVRSPSGHRLQAFFATRLSRSRCSAQLSRKNASTPRHCCSTLLCIFQRTAPSLSGSCDRAGAGPPQTRIRPRATPTRWSGCRLQRVADGLVQEGLPHVAGAPSSSHRWTSI